MSEPFVSVKYDRQNNVILTLYTDWHKDASKFERITLSQHDANELGVSLLLETLNVAPRRPTVMRFYTKRLPNQQEYYEVTLPAMDVWQLGLNVLKVCEKARWQAEWFRNSR